MSVVVYWAAPLFTQAERVRNRLCTDELRARGFSVILPQDEAAAFVNNQGIDMRGIAEHCYRQAIACDVLVAVLDGADSDSGTSVEVGLRVGNQRSHGGRAGVIGVRTDFRASEDEGLNAMFRLADEVVYFSSLDESVAGLANAVEDAIRRSQGLPAADRIV